MKLRNLLLRIVSVVVLNLGPAALLAQTPNPKTLPVSIASFGVIYYPHFVAKELGYYRDEGLNVDVIAIPGGLATQALVAGDLHFSTSSGSSLNASLRGIALKFPYVNLDRSMYKILSWRDDIRKVPGKYGVRSSRRQEVRSRRSRIRSLTSDLRPLTSLLI